MPGEAPSSRPAEPVARLPDSPDENHFLLPDEVRIDSTDWSRLGRARHVPHSASGLASLAQTILVAVAYYLAARLSLHLALVRGQVTPIWPSTGIALVGLLLFGRRIWPGITLAALLVNLPIGPSALAATVIAAGNTIAPLLAAHLL